MPVTVSVNAAEPAAAVDGERVVNVGAGLLAAVTVNDTCPEVPPPGVGLNTVTCAVPADATSAADIAAVSCVAEPNVVVRFAPFHRTTEPATKFVPVTVSVNAAEPAAAEIGVMLVNVGAGLLAAVTVNDTCPEVPPPGVGLNTVTCAVPADATSAADIAAVSCVAEPNVVVRFAPFHRTTEPATKFVPVTVSVNAAEPVAVEVGVMLVNVGAGLLAALTVNVSAEEVPPPGVGLNTVTCAVPADATSAADIAAVSCVAEPNVVVRFAPFHRTTEPATKFVPVTVSGTPPSLPPSRSESCSSTSVPGCWPPLP